MEVKGANSGVTVVKLDAPTDYHIAPRPDIAKAPVIGAPTTPTADVGPQMGLKKKRGRPRKYGPDGPVMGLALSPKPISAVAPTATAAFIDFSSEKPTKSKPPVSSTIANVLKPQQPKFEAEKCENIGESVVCSVGANFTPHVLTVHTGEDVMKKVISFSQQGSRAICILSANGVISSVTIRQPNSSGGTLTYEGRFEVLKLTGSFMPSEISGIKNRSGGLSVSLASPDGSVIGGFVDGSLVASTPVQIVVGSFITGNHHEQKTKKQKSEFIISGAPTTMNFSNVGTQETYGAPRHHASSAGYSSFREDTRNGSSGHNDSHHDG